MCPFRSFRHPGAYALSSCVVFLRSCSEHSCCLLLLAASCWWGRRMSSTKEGPCRPPLHFVPCGVSFVRAFFDLSDPCCWPAAVLWGWGSTCTEEGKGWPDPPQRRVSGPLLAAPETGAAHCCTVGGGDRVSLPPRVPPSPSGRTYGHARMASW